MFCSVENTNGQIILPNDKGSAIYLLGYKIHAFNVEKFLSTSQI